MCNHSSPFLWIPYLLRKAHTAAPSFHSQWEFSQDCSTVDSAYAAAVVLNHTDHIVDSKTCFCMGFSQSPLHSIDGFINDICQNLCQITHLESSRLALLPCSMLLCDNFSSPMLSLWSLMTFLGRLQGCLWNKANGSWDIYWLLNKYNDKLILMCLKYWTSLHPCR